MTRWSTSSRLLKNSCNVIARSDFCDAAIYNLLICLTARLLRFARKDSKKTFSTACKDMTLYLTCLIIGGYL